MCSRCFAVVSRFFFFFNDAATTEIYTLSLHDGSSDLLGGKASITAPFSSFFRGLFAAPAFGGERYTFTATPLTDRKSTRLNSSHRQTSYAVFCLNQKLVDEPRSVEHELYELNTFVQHL